jgi:thioesterase domain-containing protein
VIGTKSSSTTKGTDYEIGSGSTLVAYIVLDASYEASDKLNTAEFSILQHCQKSLAYYMVPHKILFVKEIPRSFNGKIDRKALLELFSEMSSTSPEHASKVSDSTCQNHDLSFDPSESSSVLAKLWSIWNRALNRSDQPVSQMAEHANVNLLALGATSLTLLMMRAMVQHEFSLTLPLQFFRKEPRLYQMAEMIKNEIRKRETDTKNTHSNVNGHSATSTNTRMAHVICLNRAEKPTAGPLIFFHPSTGGVEFYNQMSQLMIERTGPRHSYAIQGFGLEADETVESDFTKTIQTYFGTINSIEEITTSSSLGALTLIGYSSGGILAYAVGHEFFLHNQGNLIESIILLDTPSPITSHYLSPVTDDYATEIVVKSLNATDNNTVSLQTEVFSRLVAVTKANLVAIQTHFSKTISSSLNLEQLESLMHKMIFVFAAETYAKKDNKDPSYGWEEYFRRVAKLITKNTGTKSVESDNPKKIREDIVLKSLKKPIQSPGTHFQLLLPINLDSLVSQLHNRLSQKCNGN